VPVILDFSSRRAAKAVNKRSGQRYDPRARGGRGRGERPRTMDRGQYLGRAWPV